MSGGYSKYEIKMLTQGSKSKLLKAGRIAKSNARTGYTTLGMIVTVNEYTDFTFHKQYKNYDDLT